MTAAEGDPDTVTRPVGRYEWENVLRRVTLDTDRKRAAELQRAALMLGTWADPDGTRVRPGELEFAASLDLSKPTARRRLSALVEMGFVRLVSRGGGRGSAARASVYRLTLPTDLLDRFDVRPPASDRRMTVVTPLNHGERSYRDNSAHSRVSGVTEPSPVDNSELRSLKAERSSSGEDRELRSNNTVTERNSAQNGTQLRSPMDERPPATSPTTKTTTPGPDPTQPDTPDCMQSAETNDPPAAVQLGPRRCPHGLSRAQRDDGTPRCPACRRGLPATPEPT